MTLQRDIEQHLAPLLSATLTELGRAAALEWFTFVMPDGSTRALHVSCAWRLVRDDVILVGRSDYYRGATPEIDPWEDDDDVGTRLRDLGNDAVRELLGDGWRVSSIRADALGGRAMAFDSGAVLEVFPDAAPAAFDDWEAWRLFTLRDQSAHFVVWSDGLVSVCETHRQRGLPQRRSQQPLC